MAEATADIEKISVVMEIQGDMETRRRTRLRMLNTLRELRENGAARITCVIQTAKGIQFLETGADK